MAGILPARPGDARAVLAGFGLSLMIVAAAVLDAPADDKAPKPFDPAQIRKDMARVKARLDAQRKQMNRGAAPSAARERQAAEAVRNADKQFRARVEETARARAAQALSYRLRPGMTFGYAIDVQITRSYKSERFAGTPIFSVRSVEKDGDAVVFAIGKLRCFSRLSGSDEEQERPTRAVWVGSVLQVSPSGRVGGKEDYKATVLPVFLTTLIKLRDLFFPEITASVTGVRSEEGSSSLWLTMSGGGFFDPGVKRIEGREKRLLQAHPLTGSLVEIRKERTFRGKDTPPTVLWYKSTTRFDRDRGLMVDSTATSETEEGPVTVRIRRLEGDDLKRAVDQANIDWADRPSELDAFELRRVRVALDSPRRLNSPAEARPGMTVAHCRDGDHEWYLAQVVEVVDARRYEVKIRYRGSDEELVVHPAQLAIPPAGKTP